VFLLQISRRSPHSSPPPQLAPRSPAPFWVADKNPLFALTRCCTESTFFLYLVFTSNVFNLFFPVVVLLFFFSSNLPFFQDSRSLPCGPPFLFFPLVLRHPRKNRCPCHFFFFPDILVQPFSMSLEKPQPPHDLFFEVPTRTELQLFTAQVVSSLLFFSGKPPIFPTMSRPSSMVVQPMNLRTSFVGWVWRLGNLFSFPSSNRSTTKVLFQYMEFAMPDPWSLLLCNSLLSRTFLSNISSSARDSIPRLLPPVCPSQVFSSLTLRISRGWVGVLHLILTAFLLFNPHLLCFFSLLPVLIAHCSPLE